MRAAALLAAALAVVARAPAEETVAIGVFGLFDPQQVVIRPVDGGVLRLEVDGASKLLQGEEGIKVGTETVGSVGLQSFLLAVPGKIERRFRGRLRVRHHPLAAVIDMAVPEALAAILSAEAAPGWPAAALEAQAIVSRSYLRGPSRHDGFDFCDTTHCQYLRELPADSSRIRSAIRRTAGLRLLGAEPLYTRSCGGERCGICRRDPVAWRREFSAEVAAPILKNAGSESARLAFVRKHGWDALPSNAYEIELQRDRVVIEGRGEGHGLGLCQRGAVSMARHGAGAEEILERYFPGASLARAVTRQR